MIKVLFSLLLIGGFIQAEPLLIPQIGFGEEAFGESNNQDNLEESLAFLRNRIGGDSLLIEANLYEFGSPDGKIQPDLKRSLKIYSELYKQGNPIAAFKIGMLAWSIKKNSSEIDKGLIDIVKQTEGLDPLVYFKKGSLMNSNYRYQKIIPLIKELLGIYTFAELKDYKKTIEIMSDSSLASNAGAQIYTAFAYWELKNEALANFFLNKACNNPTKGEEITMFCSDSKVLNRQKIGE